MKKKKTIFITISRAIIARNLLLNDFIKFLNKNYKVVLFVPEEHEKFFLKKFGRYKICFFKKTRISNFKTGIKNFLSVVAKSLIYNPTIEVRTKYGIMCRSDKVRFKKLKYIVQKYLFGLFLSRIKFLRNLLRNFDSFIFPCYLYDYEINKYKPDLIFITNILFSEEVDLLRNCKKRKIKSIAMTKSWDNASKFGFREKSDKFVVWGDYMKNELINFQNYSKKEVEIVGVPQFDYYKTIKPLSRKEFCEKYGMNADKRIIFFGSSGLAFDSDPYIVSFLREQIKKGVLDNYQIFVRPHFSYNGDEKRYLSLRDNEVVFVDLDYNRTRFKDLIEVSFGTIINFMSAVKHSNVSITSASTLILDIIANGKYPVLYNFDEYKDTPYKNSVKRIYTSLWMKEILNMGLDNLADNEEEFLKKIIETDQNPKIKFKEREDVIKKFCFKNDGRSGKRLFEFLKKEIN